MTGMNWTAPAGATLLAVGVLAGCGNSPGRSAAPVVSSTCTIYAYGHDARVTFTGAGATALCAQAVRKWSGSSGYYWNYTPTAPQEGGFGSVCELSNQGVTARVMDDGGQAIGQSVCGLLAHAGWTPASTAARAPTRRAIIVDCNSQQCTSLPGAGPNGTTCDYVASHPAWEACYYK